MIFFPSAFYQQVVNVDLDIPPNLLREHFVHKPLVHCARILYDRSGLDWLQTKFSPDQRRAFRFGCNPRKRS